MARNWATIIIKLLFHYAFRNSKIDIGVANKELIMLKHLLHITFLAC